MSRTIKTTILSLFIAALLWYLGLGWIRSAAIVLLIAAAGFFDSVMDMRKDFVRSEKNWLWRMVRLTKYELWYLGEHPLPFFEGMGYTYKAGNVFLADAWHQAKHLMMLSFAGSVAVACNLNIYCTIFIWWGIYFAEGECFNFIYQHLKEE